MKLSDNRARFFRERHAAGRRQMVAHYDTCCKSHGQLWDWLAIAVSNYHRNQRIEHFGKVP